MKRIETKITIRATAEHVWQNLVDFASYPEWNPFIPSIKGKATAGTFLEILIKPPRELGRTFRPNVLKAEPGHELRWVGRLLTGWLFEGEHCFAIERHSVDDVVLHHNETFRGLLVALAPAYVDTYAAPSFNPVR